MDKLDFIRRDSYKLGCPKESFQGDILFNNARILDNEICYREKDAFSIYEIFNCRYRLYKEFYLHRVAKGIDLMIKDVFAEANAHYDFKSYLYQPEKFLKLKDSIINDILNSNSVTLKSAKEIVKRIYKRDIYKFVGEKTCIISTKGVGDYERFFKMTEEDIINCSSSYGYEEEKLKIGDIKILKCELDFCRGIEDPVKYVKFYNTESEEEKNNVDYQVKNLNSEDISLLTPRSFKEFIFRIYVKDSNKLDNAKKAFTKFCNEKSGDSPNHYQKRSATKYDRILKE
jgi:HD superfamily phosphohydrolase